jgi:hypothetical protein
MENNGNLHHHPPLKYAYLIKHILNKECNSLTILKKVSSMFLCVYKINNSGKFPFIQFLLSNNGFNVFNLPNVSSTSFEFKGDTLISYLKVFLSGILRIPDFEEFNKETIYDGFYKVEQDFYFFFNMSDYDFKTSNANISTHPLFVLPDEIINHRKVCNMAIGEDTINFFIKNYPITYLHTEYKEHEPYMLYEQPIVVYVGKPNANKLKFTYVFGESPKDKLAVLGPYYYFTNFNNAIKQGGWAPKDSENKQSNNSMSRSENGVYFEGGIVRFALYTGKTKFVENMPNYPIDESEIKKQNLDDVTLNKNYEIQTLRISDHDGKWSRMYDSVYLGNIELDDGSFLQETPIYVVKDCAQQIPLSFHFIDKTALANSYDSNNKCYRIV